MCSDTGLKSVYGFNVKARKSNFYRVFGWSFERDNVLTTTHKEVHAKKRRVVMQALSLGSIKSMQEHMLRNARILCNSLIDEDSASPVWSKPKNMSQWISLTVADTISDLCFGSNLDLLQSKKNRNVQEAFVKGIRGLHIVSNPPPIG